MNASLTQRIAAAAAVTLAALGAASTAQARDNITWSIGISSPGVVYTQPAPVYVAPAPVYVPPRVYYAPPPPPRVIYMPPPAYYHDRGRDWRRADWERRHWRHHPGRDWDRDGRRDGVRDGRRG
jgi:hypothetical protein